MAVTEAQNPVTLDSVFVPGHVIMDSKDHKYNPCNDLIFPSIVKTTGQLENARDVYHMYYAPHDSPGGICLAHAPSIEGPWIEFARPSPFVTANPVISKDWPPHYRVGHVSAPHAIWIKEESRLFVYYHGDNDQTHYATSKNGFDFEYGGVALNQKSYADFIEGKYDRVFYGRAFEHCLPSRKSKYVFLFARSSDQGPGKNGIYRSWSDDARKWSQPERIITTGDGMRFVCSPCLFTLNNRSYIAYHADFDGYTDTYVDAFDSELTVRTPLGKLIDHRQLGAENPRVSDPLVFVEGDTTYLVLDTGVMFNQRFALAKANTRELTRVLEQRN